VELCFREAGHVLGSAVSTLTLDGFRRHSRITFTGDLGRRGLPYLREASEAPASDLIISESTYAGRRHHTLEEMADRFSEVVNRTAERHGKILIPAFSLGRTQVVIHYLRTWMREGRFPWMPIYVDSRQARAISKVHEDYPELFQTHPTPADPAVHYIRTREEGQELSLQRGPAIIVASGGMCDGGRIMDHLRLHIDDPRASIVLVSYQAPGSLGSQILELRPTVRFHGRTWNKWADVVELNGFSGHADQDDLMAYLSPLASTGCKVRLVHGEVERATHLVASLLERGFDDVAIPARSESVSLN
jgi:metallo-beta-lactamase family protein